MDETAATVGFEVNLQVQMLPRQLTTLHDAVPGVTQALTAGLLPLLKEFDRTVAAARANRMLSGEGSDDATIRTFQQTEAALVQWGRTHADPLHQRIELGEKSLLASPSLPTDPAERLALELRRQEIRQTLRGLDLLERDALYLGTTDLETQLAMETSPPTVWRERDGSAALQSFVSREHIEGRRLARAEAADPQRASELRDLRTIERLYRSSVASALASIRAAVQANRFRA